MCISWRFILLLFAYSSIIGNYAYAESNIRFIKNKPWFVFLFRLMVLFFVYFGSVRSGNVVWNFADTVMAVMAIINLIAIFDVVANRMEIDEGLSTPA